MFTLIETIIGRNKFASPELSLHMYDLKWLEMTWNDLKWLEMSWKSIDVKSLQFVNKAFDYHFNDMDRHLSVQLDQLDTDRSLGHHFWPLVTKTYWLEVRASGHRSSVSGGSALIMLVMTRHSRSLHWELDGDQTCAPFWPWIAFHTFT